MPNGQVVDASELLDDNYIEIEPEDILWTSVVGLTMMRLSEIVKDYVPPNTEYRGSLSN